MNNTAALTTQQIIEAEDAADAVTLRQIWAEEAQAANRADVDMDQATENGIAILEGDLAEYLYGATGAFPTFEGFHKPGRVLVLVASVPTWVHYADISFGTQWTNKGVVARG
jgi:hypothetical protein